MDPSFPRPELDHSKRLASMRKSMEHNVEEIIVNTDVCIFTVPKTLLDTKPNSYIPEQVALGPFHQSRQQVYDMEKYKLAAARKVQERRNAKFQHIVEAVKERTQDVKVRACYDKFLDMDDDDLAWRMAFDMSFLLEFLQVYYIMESGGTGNTDIGPSLSRVFDVSRKKLSHMAILRDVVKLENQIPLFLIKTMMKHDRSFDESPTETLRIMLTGLYHEISPFEYRVKSSVVDINQCDHLLHFLYQMTVPNAHKLGSTVDDTTIPIPNPEEEDGGGSGGAGKEDSFAKSTDVKYASGYVWRVIKKAKGGFVKKILLRPITLGLKLPLKMLSRLPFLKLFTEVFGNMLENPQGETNGDIPSKNRPPVIEEITIPSVTKMAKAGFRFAPVNNTISEIRFDEKTSTLHLPVIHLGVNTEVYLRNLVAYEACVASGPLVMARYTELMNGIIDTKEDAKILMDSKIVYNHLKSEKEVADLWNGMSKCVKMTKVPFMDKVVEEVNKRYDRTWRVKLGKFMNKYVFASWKFLTLLAAVLLLLLSTVQAVCSVYSCARVIRQLPELNDQPLE
ncbi:hypothetical protein OSB04_004868 [Centaurea solstitialis]|uniref:Uncharacterized protein n=1 Tax=Centaurea solstitialis TaxID=347529 RepID=A0AA38TEW5_9ASTR|nr:hypothetical protein OSB04_004868 [Centaurea solstitialis]